MHFAGWSLAAYVAVTALLLTQSIEVAGKADKTAESSSLEDELESSLPQPQPPASDEQAFKPAKAPAPPATMSKQQHHQSAQQQQPHHLERQLESQKPDKLERQQQQQQQQQQAPGGHRPSREELRDMFRELLESMTEAERKSLTLRLGRDSVKRTFSRMRDEVRAEAPTASVSKRAMPQESLQKISHAKALRMRRSLLLGSMESGMSAARQRRKKRDLVDYSPEEYAQLVALLAADRPGYTEDAEGNIRVEGDDFEEEGPREEAAEAGEDEVKRSDDETDEDDVEERHDDPEVDMGGDVEKRDSSEDGEAAGDEDIDRRGEKGAALEEATEGLELPPLPPLPPPAPPAELRGGDREPLTMFLVRVAGEKGLFVPLDQERAQRLAVELAGEAAVAEVAEAQAAVEAAAREAAAAATAEAEADAEKARQEAGVAELKRFAEKLARRIPPGL